MAAAACVRGPRAATTTRADIVDPRPTRSARVTDTPTTGSLDDLHQRVIASGARGSPGAVPQRPVEPNLSTPALTYAYLVGRPAIEKLDRLRVRPHDAAHSLLVDKLRNRNGVSDPDAARRRSLDEADIQAIERGSTAALRAPGADPPPQLNNPPHAEVAIYSSTGTRLDGAGTGPHHHQHHARAAPQRADFETADDAIPFDRR